MAARHDIRPKKSLGQHFLIEPELARRIAELSGARAGGRVLEIGAGLGSLTVALGRTGAHVLAMEVDRRLIPAVQEAVAGLGRVRVIEGDATRIEWPSVLHGNRWAVVANLPYNVSVPVVMGLLQDAPMVDRLLVMVQREVGERLAAEPGDPRYGAVSVRVAYRAEAKVVRSVSRSVFWPRPNVDSVLVSIVRRTPGVNVDEAALFRAIDVAFGQRRKSMRGALRRLGLEPDRAAAILAVCGLSPLARPEQLALQDFACIAGHLQPPPGTSGAR